MEQLTRVRAPRGRINAWKNWTLDEDSGCWIFQGPRDRTSGYGPYKRVWEHFHGERPAGYDLHHICRNGPGGCIRPDHLDLLTTSEHRTMHRREKGILSLDDAREVRRLLLDLSNRTNDIAARYGVGPDQIQRIGRGKNFKELGGPLAYVKRCPWCGVEFETASREKDFCVREHSRLSSERQLAQRRKAERQARRMVA